MSDPFDDVRLTAVGLLIEAHDGVLARLGEVHARHGLSNTTFDVLVRLARTPGHRLRMGDLAAQTALSTSGITRIVDRLERDGLVRRRPSPDDRRSQTAVLTDAGRKRVEEVLPELLDAIDSCFTGRLSPGALDALLASLHAVRHTVRPGATAGSAAEPPG